MKAQLKAQLVRESMIVITAIHDRGALDERARIIRILTRARRIAKDDKAANKALDWCRAQIVEDK